MLQSSRRASTTSRCAMMSMGRSFDPDFPRYRATMLPLRSFGPITVTSAAGKPASRSRFAIACAAIVVLPTESVVLISISCLKMSCARVRADSSFGAAGHADCRAAAHKRIAAELAPIAYFKCLSRDEKGEECGECPAESMDEGHEVSDEPARRMYGSALTAGADRLLRQA